MARRFRFQDGHGVEQICYVHCHAGAGLSAASQCAVGGIQFHFAWRVFVHRSDHVQPWISDSTDTFQDRCDGSGPSGIGDHADQPHSVRIADCDHAVWRIGSHTDGGNHIHGRVAGVQRITHPDGCACKQGRNGRPDHQENPSKSAFDRHFRWAGGRIAGHEAASRIQSVCRLSGRHRLAGAAVCTWHHP